MLSDVYNLFKIKIVRVVDMSAETVLEHHLDCFGRGDVDGIVSDYSSDSVLFTQSGVLVGRDKIRTRWVGRFPSLV